MSGSSALRTALAGEIELEAVRCVVCGGLPGAAVAAGCDYEYLTSPATFTFVACRDCGHVFLHPRPTRGMAAAIYPAHYYTVSGSHRSASLSLLGRIKDRVVLRRLRHVLPSLRQGGRVLEIGAGDGALLLALRATRPDADLHALDLRFAPEHRAALERQSVRCIEGLLEDARLPSDCDLIIMNQLIEHLWDLEGGMRKVAAALRPAGLVSVATPNLDGYDRRWFGASSWGGYHFPRHLNLFTGDSLAGFLQRHGLRAVGRSSLAAPLIWLATCQNVAGRRGWRLRWFLRESNLPLLSVFTLFDLAMAAAGRATSNQQLVAARL